MDLYVYCAGGFGKEVMDIARRRNRIDLIWRNIIFVDDILDGKYKYGSKLVKLDKVVANGKIADSEFLIASGEPAVRHKIREKLGKASAKLAQLVDTSTVLAETARISAGVIIAPLCSISSDAVLECNSCVNTMSIIGHDVYIGENSVISSMVNMGGASFVGSSSYIGMGALIKEGIKIGSNSIVGMGSVVYNDVPDGVIALGNPARVVRKNENQKVFR